MPEMPDEIKKKPSNNVTPDPKVKNNKKTDKATQQPPSPEPKKLVVKNDVTKLKSIGTFFYDLGFNMTTAIYKDGKKRPYVPTRRKALSWTRTEKEDEVPLTKAEFLQSIDAIDKKGLGIVLGYFPGQITWGKHVGKFSWTADFDDPDNIKTCDVTLKKCREMGTYFERTRTKGHHQYGISGTPVKSVKRHDLKLELLGTDSFVAIHNHFEHDFYDLKDNPAEEVFGRYIKAVCKHLGVPEVPVAEKPPRFLGENPDCVENILKGGLGIEKWNDTAFALACWYRQRGLNLDEITLLMFEWNKKNLPPDTPRELEAIIKSAFKSDKLTGCNKIRELGFCPYKEMDDCPFYNPKGEAKEPEVYVDTTLPEVGYKLVDKFVALSLVPQIISERRVVPVVILYKCPCGHEKRRKMSPAFFFQYGFKPSGGNKCPTCKEKKLSKQPVEFVNCFVIQAMHPLRDIKLDPTSKVANQVKKIEESRTIKPMKVYYVTTGKATPAFGVYKIKGRVAIDTTKKPYRFFLIANEMQPERDYFLNYKITPEDRKNFKKYFADNENLESDISETIAPSIVGRDLAKFFCALVQHSVLYIREDTLGILSVLLGGDSRCAKTVIIIDIVFNLSPVGCEYATAETATRTGISYTIIQVGDSWEVEWGILPLCDKMLVGLDGLQAWEMEEIMQLREVMSQGFIRVRRAVKADSPARVRRIGALNFSARVATIPTRWHATWMGNILGPVDRNRWPFIFVFGENDITKEEINRRHKLWEQGKIKRKIPQDVWRKHVIWVWQLTPDRIVMPDDTLERLEEIVNEIHAMFQDSKVKPFTNELFMTCEKMTVAYAALKHSTDDMDRLVVKPEHADMMKVKFLEYIDHLELEKVRLTEEFLPMDELEAMISEVTGTTKEKILLYIGNHQGCKQIDIANVLKVDKSYVSREINWFQTNQLITSRTKLRFSENGAALYRKLLSQLDKTQQGGEKKVDSTNSSTQRGGVGKNSENNVEKPEKTNKKKEGGGLRVDRLVESTFGENHQIGTPKGASAADLSQYVNTIRHAEEVVASDHLTLHELAQRTGISAKNDINFLEGIVDAAINDPTFDTLLGKDDSGLYYNTRTVKGATEETRGEEVAEIKKGVFLVKDKKSEKPESLPKGRDSVGPVVEKAMLEAFESALSASHASIEEYIATVSSDSSGKVSVKSFSLFCEHNLHVQNHTGFIKFLKDKGIIVDCGDDNIRYNKEESK